MGIFLHCILAIASTVTNIDDDLSEGTLRQAIIDINQLLGTPETSNTIDITAGSLSLTSMLPLFYKLIFQEKRISPLQVPLSMEAEIPPSQSMGALDFRGFLVPPPALDWIGDFDGEHYEPQLFQHRRHRRRWSRRRRRDGRRPFCRDGNDHDIDKCPI